VAVFRLLAVVPTTLEEEKAAGIRRCDAKFEEKSPSPSSLGRPQFSSHHLNSSNSLGVCVL